MSIEDPAIGMEQHQKVKWGLHGQVSGSEVRTCCNGVGGPGWLGKPLPGPLRGTDGAAGQRLGELGTGKEDATGT